MCVCVCVCVCVCSVCVLVCVCMYVCVCVGGVGGQADRRLLWAQCNLVGNAVSRLICVLYLPLLGPCHAKTLGHMLTAKAQISLRIWAV